MCDFLLQWNGGLFRQSQRLTKILRQCNGHGPGASRVRAGQCADGVQAVEQEVRVDLAAQHLQFSRLCQRQ